MHIDFLSSANMREVLDLLWDYRERWKSIGTTLGIDTGILDAIDKDSQEYEESLVKLISTWLQGNNPRPTWSAMTIALQAQQVAGGVTSVQGV